MHKTKQNKKIAMQETIEELSTKEARKLTRIVKRCNLDKDRLTILKPIIENVAFMKIKLDDAREAIKESSVAIQYNNGGGQSGIRENPIFKGYEALWKSYIQGIGKIIEMIPDEEDKEELLDNKEHVLTAIEIVKNKHNQET